jgi:IS605 OrfB family transposase
MTMRKLIKEEKPKWIEEIEMPSHLIDQSFMEASKNYKTNIKIYNETGRKFELKKKTKKDKYQTMNIEKVMLNKETKTLFGGIKKNKKSVFKNIKLVEDIKRYKICDSSISYNRQLGEYVLNLNYETENKISEEELKNDKVCGIDVGIKTYLTVYSEDRVDMIGCNIMERINKVCKEIDIIKSRIETEKKEYKLRSEKKRNLRRALHRKIKYLENMRSEMQNKAIKYITANYGRIIIPPFEIQKMVCNYRTKIARSLYNIGNNKLMEKLKNKSKNIGIELIVRPEYYTSKTCTNCGKIKRELTLKDRVYKCNGCGIEIERDMNGARNILLRNNRM